MMGTSRVQRLRLETVAAEFLERMGAQIRARRDELRLSRAEVARRMPGKVNENQVYRWEKGLHQPNPDTLQALAKVLDTDVAVFMSAPADKGSTPEPFAREQSDDDVAARLVEIEARLGAIEDQLSLLLGAASIDGESQGDLADRIVKTVERAINQRATEVARPQPRRDRAQGQSRQPRRDAA